MRVERAKNKQVEKSESRLNKTEKSVYNSTTQLKKNDSPPPPANGVFAKILEESRRQNRPDKNKTTSENQTETASESTKPEKEITRRHHDKTEKEQKQDNQNQSGDGNSENNSGTPLFNFSTKINPEFPARAILHIADLERIVSAIRTESFKTYKQALITLKNSVLEGLQIKITIAEEGKLKAEFVAQNKQIKKQIESRKRELKEIFRSRSLNITEIEVITISNDK